jgi:hypothetical protein
MTYLLLMLGLSVAAIIVNGWIVCAGIIAALMGLGIRTTTGRKTFIRDPGQ